MLEADASSEIELMLPRLATVFCKGLGLQADECRSNRVEGEGGV